MRVPTTVAVVCALALSSRRLQRGRSGGLFRERLLAIACDTDSVRVPAKSLGQHLDGSGLVLDSKSLAGTRSPDRNASQESEP